MKIKIMKDKKNFMSVVMDENLRKKILNETIIINKLNKRERKRLLEFYSDDENYKKCRTNEKLNLSIKYSEFLIQERENTLEKCKKVVCLLYSDMSENFINRTINIEPVFPLFDKSHYFQEEAEFILKEFNL